MIGGAEPATPRAGTARLARAGGRGEALVTELKATVTHVVYSHGQGPVAGAHAAVTVPSEATAALEAAEGDGRHKRTVAAATSGPSRCGKRGPAGPR